MKIHQRRIHFSGKTAASAGVLIACVLVAGFAFGSELEITADSFFARFANLDIETPSSAVPSVERQGAFTFKQLENHPDNLHRVFSASPRLAFAGDSLAGAVSGHYKDLLSVYRIRQGVDDNFTMRAIDMRTGGLIGITTLDSLRNLYEQSGYMDWQTVDRARRKATTQLVDDIEERGYDRDSIAVKWGRMNQVLEARQRELPYIEYEVALAQYFNLSLLATEIGTVETFNNDRVVSRVGARSRYQIMPSVLRDFGINHYRLSTRGSRTISVYEEWHPLLSMEVSMKIVRAYSNAVGHEIPGISAYHTGPFNIFHIFRTFLEEAGPTVGRSATTEFAYLWGITDGFESIRTSSSFRGYSRGYIPAGYGSLRTTDELSIDTTRTRLAERVRLAEGSQVYLSELLNLLSEAAPELDWRTDERDSTLYQKFKSLNGHMNLPRQDGSQIPPNGDALLVRTVKGKPVRIFLPLGASAAIAEAGVTMFDPDETFEYKHEYFGSNLVQEKTVWDREYEQLVEAAGRFEFSEENRSTLYDLVAKFEELAAVNPSYYRRTQLEIIKQHRWIWRSKEFAKLLNSIDQSGIAERTRRSYPMNELRSMSPQPVQSPLADTP
ncbi:MAG: hypothetical protein HKN43_02530 [Rhodothermales bacterium]|nr:hypothetical protein [Rhodothermales bacterium]